MLETLLNVGQLQLLRKQIFFTLNQNARCFARNYTSALANLNEALLNEVKAFEKGLVSQYPSDEELAKVSVLLDWVGLGDPYAKIYITTRSIPYMALLVFVFTSSQVPRFQHDKALDCLLCKKTGEGIMPFLLGLQTLLRQFHPTVHKQFVLYCCQYTKSYMLNSTFSIKQQEIPHEALSMMQFLDEYVDYSGLTRSEITKHIPPVIFDLFKYGIATYVDS
ncbi:hypothetical protein AAG570_013992 [Ranatra chinensis]|uniref:Uncharacterized protein n=1 Tax=Ranatra chinensis TaxID=642074 RepID=A0ABD0YDS0_9HEMI